ncbi:unnamed protein product [Amoebophrya sp. A120]|nr:unnamed protein product [Amoebophrya sp. A120]|eukprot:GSA120T00010219001.1
MVRSSTSTRPHPCAHRCAGLNWACSSSTATTRKARTSTSHITLSTSPTGGCCLFAMISAFFLRVTAAISLSSTTATRSRLPERAPPMIVVSLSRLVPPHSRRTETGNRWLLTSQRQENGAERQDETEATETSNFHAAPASGRIRSSTATSTNQHFPGQERPSAGGASASSFSQERGCDHSRTTARTRTNDPLRRGILAPAAKTGGVVPYVLDPPQLISYQEPTRGPAGVQKEKQNPCGPGWTPYNQDIEMVTNSDDGTAGRLFIPTSGSANGHRLSSQDETDYTYFVDEVIDGVPVGAAAGGMGQDQHYFPGGQEEAEAEQGQIGNNLHGTPGTSARTGVVSTTEGRKINNLRQLGHQEDTATASSSSRHHHQTCSCEQLAEWSSSDVVENVPLDSGEQQKQAATQSEMRNLMLRDIVSEYGVPLLARGATASSTPGPTMSSGSGEDRSKSSETLDKNTSSSSTGSSVVGSAGPGHLQAQQACSVREALSQRHGPSSPRLEPRAAQRELSTAQQQVEDKALLLHESSSGPVGQSSSSSRPVGQSSSMGQKQSSANSSSCWTVSETEDDDPDTRPRSNDDVNSQRPISDGTASEEAFSRSVELYRQITSATSTCSSLANYVMLQQQQSRQQENAMFLDHDDEQLSTLSSIFQLPFAEIISTPAAILPAATNNRDGAAAAGSAYQNACALASGLMDFRAGLLELRARLLLDHNRLVESVPASSSSSIMVGQQRLNYRASDLPHVLGGGHLQLHDGGTRRPTSTSRPASGVGSSSSRTGGIFNDGHQHDGINYAAELRSTSVNTNAVPLPAAPSQAGAEPGIWGSDPQVHRNAIHAIDLCVPIAERVACRLAVRPPGPFYNLQSGASLRGT